MANEIKHDFTSGKSDGGDATLVRPSNWNADHTGGVRAQAATVIIPGLAGSRDIAVSGGSDDEFDTTDTSDPMTGWTTLGSPTHDINSTRKSHYYVSSSAASVALQGIYKAATPAFTVTAKLADYLFTTNNSHRAGLFIAEASPGKISSVGATFSGQMAVDQWTSRTAFASQTGAVTVYRMPYLRIVVTSSTNIAYYVSFEGYTWTALLTGNNPGYTVGAAGLYINPIGSLVEAYFDWIRFS